MSKSNVSEKQLAANRANAQRSTGPTSEKGKKSPAATPPGITMAEEDRAAHNSRLKGLAKDMKPWEPSNAPSSNPSPTASGGSAAPTPCRKHVRP